MKIAGIVVTYNRKLELLKNVEQILNQSLLFDKYYIIDNCSTDGTYDYLFEHKVFDNECIEYVRLRENIGGAGGFSQGVKIAYEDGCDLICLMDDDGRPYNKYTIEALYRKACELVDSGHELIMINSVVTYNGEDLSFGLGNVAKLSELSSSLNNEYIGYVNPFNGTMITRQLVDRIGIPNGDFFIRGDDVDYYKRAVNVGAYIATVTDSIYYHPTFEMFEISWKGRKITVGTCSPWKSYYQIRNYTYIYKRDSGFIAAIKEAYFQFYCAKRINKQYNECKRFMIKGFWDGMSGKLGKTVQPGQSSVNVAK